MGAARGWEAIHSGAAAFLKTELLRAASDLAALRHRTIPPTPAETLARRLVSHRVDDVIQHDSYTQCRELFRIRRIVSPLPRIARVVVKPRRHGHAPLLVEDPFEVGIERDAIERLHPVEPGPLPENLIALVEIEQHVECERVVR